MKTETQIAKENIKSMKEGIIGLPNFELLNTHKATCQRFLGFLESFWNNTTAKESAWMTIMIKDKITDLKQAIKLYNEAGI